METEWPYLSDAEELRLNALMKAWMRTYLIQKGLLPNEDDLNV